MNSNYPRNFVASSKMFWKQGGYYFPNPSNVQGRVWYVDTIRGSDSNAGRSSFNPDSPNNQGPFETMARAFEVIESYDSIQLAGVVREQLVGPAGVFDITISGSANRPRQATSGGTPTGGGATWMPPASGAEAATPLLKLIEQGWTLDNIQLVPHTSSACVTIERADDSPERDGSHATIVNCRLVGGTTANGILFLNGGYNCMIANNMFESLTGTAILSSGTSVQVPLANQILYNYFVGCTNSIAISSTNGLVMGNVFRIAADDANNKVNMVSVGGQGATNMVLENYFSDAAANVTIAKGYKPGTTDVWRNFVTDVAAYIVTVPA